MHFSLRATAALLLVACTVSTPPALAQTERGVGWWSGGGNWQAGRNNLFQDRTEQATLNAGITQGFFVRDNLLIGADLRLLRQRFQTRQGFNFDAVSDSRQTTFSAAPFVRRFWGKQALRGYVGGGLSVAFGRERLLTANTQQPESERESSSWRLTPEFQAGVFYAIDSRWGVDLSTQSGLLPVAFNSLNLSLVLLTDVHRRSNVPAPKTTPTQLRSGNWLLAGSFAVGGNQQQLISGGSQSTTIQRQVIRDINIAPSVGYMSGSRWVVGLAVPYQYQKLTNEFNRSASDRQTGIAIVESMGVEPFAKKYLSKRSFGPFVGARAGWRRQRTSGDGTVSTQSSRYNWRVGGGLAYLLGTRFIVEGELAGIGSDWTVTAQNDDAQRSTDITLTFRPNLSLSYVFL